MEKRTVVVTGASSGVGLAAVEGQHHRDVVVLPPATGQLTHRDVDQAHEGAAAHVGHEERDP